MKPKQRGLSLIELLVALAISSLLILGITQIYIDNKSNYLFQQGQSDNNENARYTLLVLEEELRRTGYRIQPDLAIEESFRAESRGNCTFGRGEVINFNANAQRICLRYQPQRDGLVACDGAPQTGPAEPYNSSAPSGGAAPNIIVELDYFSGDLRCNGQPVTNNLVDFQLEFGVNDQDLREALTYTSAPTAAEAIQSVRYAALVKSRSENLADNTESTVFARWQSSRYGLEGATAPDRALYQIAESTINLRNLTR